MPNANDQTQCPTPPPSFKSIEDVRIWAHETFPHAFAILPSPELVAFEAFKGGKKMVHPEYSGFVFTKFTLWKPYSVAGRGTIEVLATVVGTSLKACEIRNKQVERATPLFYWLKGYGPTFMDVFNGHSAQECARIALEIEAIIIYYLAAKGQPAIEHCGDLRMFGWNLQRACERISGRSFVANPTIEVRDIKQNEAAPIANSSRPIDHYQPGKRDNVPPAPKEMGNFSSRLDTQPTTTIATYYLPTHQREQLTPTKETIRAAEGQLGQLTARLEQVEANTATALRLLYESKFKCVVLQDAHKKVEERFGALKQDHHSLKSDFTALETCYSSLDSEHKTLRDDHMALNMSYMCSDAERALQTTRLAALEERMDKAYSALSQQKRQLCASDVKLRVNQQESMAHIVEIEACIELFKQELMERDTKAKVASMSRKHEIEVKHD
ncbi:hypothetical protein NX059_000814 [Plenodomus lindquistii]|nr:hypothetical protein NX059_000814 [Plenodomus lindquistii]